MHLPLGHHLPNPHSETSDTSFCRHFRCSRARVLPASSVIPSPASVEWHSSLATSSTLGMGRTDGDKPRQHPSSGSGDPQPSRVVAKRTAVESSPEAPTSECISTSTKSAGGGGKRPKMVGLCCCKACGIKSTGAVWAQTVLNKKIGATEATGDKCCTCWHRFVEGGFSDYMAWDEYCDHVHTDVGKEAVREADGI